MLSVSAALVLAAVSAAPPAEKAPAGLAPPIKLRLEHASIDRLTVVRGDIEREIGPLTIDVHAGSKSLAFGIEPAQTPWGRLTVRADIAMS